MEELHIIDKECELLARITCVTNHDAMIIPRKGEMVQFKNITLDNKEDTGFVDFILHNYILNIVYVKIHR